MHPNHPGEAGKSRLGRKSKDTKFDGKVQVVLRFLHTPLNIKEESHSIHQQPFPLAFMLQYGNIHFRLTLLTHHVREIRPAGLHGIAKQAVGKDGFLMSG